MRLRWWFGLVVFIIINSFIVTTYSEQWVGWIVGFILGMVWGVMSFLEGMNSAKR